MVSRFVFDPHYIRNDAAGRIDLWGIGFLALGLGTLQIVLDTGQKNDWLASTHIRIYTVLCGALVGLIIRELKARDPVVDLRALTDRSFATGVFLITKLGITKLGFVLYASLVLLPIYLQTLLGYPAYNAGLALSPRGIGSLLRMPITGYLTSKIDPRRLLVVGLILAAMTRFNLSHLNLNAGYWDIFWPQVFQGVALALLFIPLMTLAMSRIPKEKMGNATSIFNLMRNIGGSFGIAIMTTFLARRNQFHQTSLSAHLTVGDLKTRTALAGLQSTFHAKGFDTVASQRKAFAALYGMVQRHATMLTFVEAFWMMALIFLAMLPCLLLLRRPQHQMKSKTSPVSQLEAYPEPASADTEKEREPCTEEEEEALELLMH